jgi:hypothetical protein
MTLIPTTVLAFLRRGDDVDAADWQALRETHPEAQGGGEPALMVVRVADEGALRAALAPPNGGLIEWPPTMTVADMCAALDATALPTLALRLTTASALRLDIARQLVEALDLRVTWSRQTRDNVQLALHEAVSNAVVHGNLGLPGMARRRLGDLGTFAESLRARLAEPELAARTVSVDVYCLDGSVMAAVQDEGDGHEGVSSVAVQAHGRGLQIIAALAHSIQFSHGGRRIEMEFRPC